MIVKRCEQTIIKRSHPKYKIIDQQCRYTKDLYNEANYVIRQEYVANNNYISYQDMNREFKTHENYKKCFSQPANCVMRLLDKNWKSYFASMKDWKKHPWKYKGMPKMPKYLDKDGRFPWMIPNNQLYYDYEKSTVYIRNRLLNDFEWKCRCLGRLIQVRFIPKGTCYVMDIVYEIEVPDVKECSSRIVSIDLGIDNLITMTNNIGEKPIIVNGKILKSINRQYNKQKSKMQFELIQRNEKHWSNALSNLSFKRYCRVKNFMHNASKYVVQWCYDNSIDTLVVGRNKFWKQGKRYMQDFLSIPYYMLLNQIKYKCENLGIKYIETEESYTSGTSHLDDELPIAENYDKSRRKYRGIFQAKTTLINADVNGSLQIMRKVFPDSYTGYGIEVDLTPTIINVI